MSAPDYVPVYYLSGIAGSITAVLLGARSWNAKQRQRWTNEGAANARHTEALEANTRAAADNTAAIGKLAGKLDGFADETRRELAAHNGQLIIHGQEIGRLKEIVGDGKRGRAGG